MNNEYVHGYTDREAERLYDQAGFLSELLHSDTVFPEGSLILEAGCGTGAQTVIMAPKNPKSRFISIDISEVSINKARELIKGNNITNVNFETGDIYNLSFKENYFDHIVVCFVLEHLKTPAEVLIKLKRMLKPGGTVTLIEGDHGSAYFYPDDKYARLAIGAQVTLQAENGGNALIGRELYPLLKKAGYRDCRVTPRVVYADAGRPEAVKGFTINTFTAMIEGIGNEAISKSIISKEDYNKGIKALYKTASDDGVFNYTFFKGVGYK